MQKEDITRKPRSQPPKAQTEETHGGPSLFKVLTLLKSIDGSIQLTIISHLEAASK